jgi:hypothetical protein
MTLQMDCNLPDLPVSGSNATLAERSAEIRLRNVRSDDTNPAHRRPLHADLVDEMDRTVTRFVVNNAGEIEAIY